MDKEIQTYIDDAAKKPAAEAVAKYVNLKKIEKKFAYLKNR